MAQQYEIHCVLFILHCNRFSLFFGTSLQVFLVSLYEMWAKKQVKKPTYGTYTTEELCRLIYIIALVYVTELFSVFLLFNFIQPSHQVGAAFDVSFWVPLCRVINKRFTGSDRVFWSTLFDVQHRL